MDEIQGLVQMVTSVEERTVTDVFHRVNSLLPEYQEVVCTTPEATVSEALDLMVRHNYSQLPVKADTHVLGVISYRSIARKVLELGTARIDIKDLPVAEFMERLEFVHIFQELNNTLSSLDRDGAILVGQPDRLQGIVTPMDILRHLFKFASPFVLLAEIELSLRRLIEASVDESGFRECIRLSIGHLYEHEALPASVKQMTFNHYAQVIGDGRNWPRFQQAFGGPGDWYRKNVRTKLEELRELRNDVFHFRRELDENDIDRLVAHRDWLLMRATAFEKRT